MLAWMPQQDGSPKFGNRDCGKVVAGERCGSAVEWAERQLEVSAFPHLFPACSGGWHWPEDAAELSADGMDDGDSPAKAQEQGAERRALSWRRYALLRQQSVCMLWRADPQYVRFVEARSASVAPEAPPEGAP